MYRLVGRLPRLSHYKRAVADDPELAELMAAQITDLDDEDSTPVRELTLADWDANRDMAADIVDKLAEVIGAVLAPHVKTMPKIAVARRPKTEQQKAVAARVRVLEDEFVDDIVSMATPDQEPI